MRCNVARFPIHSDSGLTIRIDTASPRDVSGGSILSRDREGAVFTE
jgi:hypothetical protein